MAASKSKLAAEVDDGPLPASLKNVVDQKTLQWIFVGGKGGVGKTTTSCCLSIQLAKGKHFFLMVSLNINNLTETPQCAQRF
jgi:arsenite-transporting ATPase